MNEAERNLLFLTLYLLCIAYIFYQMYDILSQLITVEFDQDFLNTQLQQQNLTDTLEISFQFRQVYHPDELQKFLIRIKNKSEDCTLYIDWDQNIIVDLEARSRRVLRISPGVTLDFSKAQVFSIIAPSQVLEETLTTEATLTRNDDEALEITDPLFPPKAVQQAVYEEKPFTLRLLLQVSPLASGLTGGRLHALECRFFLNKPTWRQSLGWKPNEANRKSLRELA
jgi:hypothetical protein